MPVIGPGAAVVIAGVMAIDHAEGPGAIIAYAIYATALRLSIDQLVGPLVLGHAARLHPTLVIFCFLSGGLLLGIAGLILAVPIALFSLRLTRILLFETSVRDPWVALITLATVAVAVVAGALRPTLAAMTADPSVCMRDVQ